MNERLYRILLADDDAAQLDLCKQLLEIAGYQVDIAFNAPQAFQRLQSHPPNLVITDLRLPHENDESDAREGLALIRRIREIGSPIPILVLSGWPNDIYGQPEEQLVSRVLLKPVKTRELLHTIQELLTL